jgi:hypothetical protein
MIDFSHVLDVKPPERLILLEEMKLAGGVILDISIVGQFLIIIKVCYGVFVKVG